MRQTTFQSFFEFLGHSYEQSPPDYSTRSEHSLPFQSAIGNILHGIALPVILHNDCTSATQFIKRAIILSISGFKRSGINKSRCNTKVMQKQCSTTCFNRRKDTKKQSLNKFLSKTYYCISECDPSIASWSNAGRSFTIYDTELFEKEILPKYFATTKFGSFQRQLNFYRFSREASDPDLQLNSKAVRYSHEYFRQGHPELLHQIQRSTMTRVSLGPTEAHEPAWSELQNELGQLQERMNDLERSFDAKIEEERSRIEAQYSSRICNLETLFAVIMPRCRPLAPFPVHPDPLRETAASLANLADSIRSQDQNK